MKSRRSFLSGLRLRRIRTCYGGADKGAGLHLVLTGRDDLLTRRKTAIDHRAAVDGLADLDVAQLSLVLLIDDVGVKSVVTMLDGVVGHHCGILERLHQQARGD